MRPLLIALLLALVLALAPSIAGAELRGHGGPVRAVAVLADGSVVSGSFDSTVIRWDVARGAASAVLRFHQSGVNAVVALPDGRFASTGEDAAIAIWTPGRDTPAQVLQGHQAPVAALAARGPLLASASWDRTVRVWNLADGSVQLLQGHADNVNAVAFLPDGRLASAGQDLTIRLWREDGSAEVVGVGVVLNALAAAPDGTLYAAGADGQVHALAPGGALSAIRVGRLPLVTVAADARRVAAGGIRGSVSVFTRPDHGLAYVLDGPGLPVWSVALAPDAIVTGGTDRRVRRWELATGRHIGAVAPDEPNDPAARLAGHPGADVWRACQACHTLTPDGANRAGPTLHGIFGRRIGTLAGYDFSPALRAMDLVWTPETVSRLFELGPNAYLPGTKMPEQTLGEEERRDLMDFLGQASR